VVLVVVPAISRAASPGDAPSSNRVLEREVDGLVRQLLASPGAKPGHTMPADALRYEGMAWESGPDGPVGTSGLGVRLDGAVKGALASRGIAPATGPSVGSKGIGGTLLRGSFHVLKSGVGLTLSLVNSQTGQVLSEARRMLSPGALTSLPVEQYLPPGAGNARQLVQLVRESFAGGSSAFGLRISTDKGEQAAYYEGEALHVSVQADRDCYLRLYHISGSERALTLVFPNRNDRNSFVPAGSVKLIPSAGAGTTFEVSKPYGVDALIAVASAEPFDDDAWVNEQLGAPPGGTPQSGSGSSGEPAYTPSSSSDSGATTPYGAPSSQGQGTTTPYGNPSWQDTGTATQWGTTTTTESGGGTWGQTSKGVTRVGAYLAVPQLTKERAKGILAKGLLVRYTNAAPGAHGTPQSSPGGTPWYPATPTTETTTPGMPAQGLPGDSSTHHLARSVCYYTTLPRFGPH
jgi:hypothetical protein